MRYCSRPGRVQWCTDHPAMHSHKCGLSIPYCSKPHVSIHFLTRNNCVHWCRTSIDPLYAPVVFWLYRVHGVCACTSGVPFTSIVHPLNMMPHTNVHVYALLHLVLGVCSLDMQKLLHLDKYKVLLSSEVGTVVHQPPPLCTHKNVACASHTTSIPMYLYIFWLATTVCIYAAHQYIRYMPLSCFDHMGYMVCVHHISCTIHVHSAPSQHDATY